MIFKDISELEKKMTPEQKKKAKEMYDKYYGIPYGNKEPILCGPEGRAQAKGPEALKAYYADGEKYLVEVDLEDWD